jgi:exodeoxyribonuclease-3
MISRAGAVLDRAPSTAAKKMVTLNICGPSLGRAERLAAYLRGLGADVLVLTETRDNEGTNLLLHRLREAGYGVSWVSPARHERGVAVASRPGPTDWSHAPGVDLHHRLVVVRLDDRVPVNLVAAYVPSRDASEDKIFRKRNFLRQMADVLRRTAGVGTTIFMGDLNIIGRDHVPKYPVFKAWEYDTLEEIAAIGFIDVFAELNPGLQAHSWVGRNGAGYRYDYAFVSPDLMGSVQSCSYIHEPRLEGLTDHAAVQLELRAVWAV